MGDIEGIRVIGVCEDDAIFWDDIEEAAEGGFDFVEILEDIGMIELEVVEDDQFGEVVEEFGTLVEEGGVVFIAFEDDVLRGV